jgi:hypothetical protein
VVQHDVRRRLAEREEREKTEREENEIESIREIDLGETVVFGYLWSDTTVQSALERGAKKGWRGRGRGIAGGWGGEREGGTERWSLVRFA